jgi:hypothetical protein
MHDKSPAFMHERILRMLHEHKLPRLHTRLYEGPSDMPAELVAVAESGCIGRPVATCIGDDDHWTLLGTEGLAGRARSSDAVINFSSVREIRDAGTFGHSVTEPARTLSKVDMLVEGEPRCLELLDNEDVRRNFWFGSPEEFSAFWNILRRLTNLNGKVAGLR